jgi:hypothetical protein
VEERVLNVVASEKLALVTVIDAIFRVYVVVELLELLVTHLNEIDARAFVVTQTTLERTANESFGISLVCFCKPDLSDNT